jgi:hypothetical protein
MVVLVERPPNGGSQSAETRGLLKRAGVRAPMSSLKRVSQLIRSLRRATFLLLAFFELGCATTQLAGTAEPSIEQATLSVDERQYRLDACSSGDLEYFLGVDLADQARSAFVRLVIDPLDGPRVKVVLRNGEAREELVLGPEQCLQLDAGVKPTGWRINTVRDFSGFVSAECRREDGRAVNLHVRFFHCH